MPRDPLRDDYDDQPHRRQTNPVLILAIIVGAVATVGAAGAPGRRAARGRPGPVGPPRLHPRRVPPARHGQTPAEVIAAAGEPDEAFEDGAVTRWKYRGRVQGAPGKGAATSLVVFRDGKAAEVTD
jgi:hypothetical protein